jgi:hypothetical protein
MKKIIIIAWFFMNQIVHGPFATLEHCESVRKLAPAPSRECWCVKYFDIDCR